MSNRHSQKGKEKKIWSNRQTQTQREKDTDRLLDWQSGEKLDVADFIFVFKFAKPYLPQFLCYNYDSGLLGNDIQSQRIN